MVDIVLQKFKTENQSLVEEFASFPTYATAQYLKLLPLTWTGPDAICTALEIYACPAAGNVF